MLPVAILAGGLATRLRPITEKIPKALVPVAGRPFIERQLEYLKSQNVVHVVICAGHMGEKIEAAVGDGRAYGLNVSYSYDGPLLLGTGGALKRACDKLGSEFFVLYGDSYLPVDFSSIAAAFDRKKYRGLMTVLENRGRWDTSNVYLEQGKIVEYNKKGPRADMHHIDYGLGILTPEVFKSVSAEATFDLADMYHQLSIRGELAAFEVDQRFYEIGSHQGLQETEEFFKTRACHDIYRNTHR